MAERVHKCEVVPESMERSKSDAKQLELERKAQDCPPSTLDSKPDGSSGGKSRHDQTSAEDGEASDSMAALSASNLKRSVGVVSTPESSDAGQERVFATSVSSTDTQTSRSGPATVHAMSAVNVHGVSPASSTVNENASMVPNIDQNMPCKCNQNKHLGGAALADMPKRVSEAVATMRNLSVSRRDGRRISPLERELGVSVRDEDGAVDLSRARQARLWNSSCCSCHEQVSEVTMMPCGHSVLCRRCFLDPGCDEAFKRCPLCGQQKLSIGFSSSMMDFLLRRSAM